MTKRIRRIMLAVIAAVLLLGSGGERKSPIEVPDISGRINEFSVDLLRLAAGGESAPANMILSPQSIYHGLAMNYIASGGDTRAELATALHFPDDDKLLMQDVKELRESINKSAKKGQIDIVMSNGLWIDERFADFRKDYLKAVERAFDATPRRARFTQKEASSAAINAWVAEQTRGRITQSVRPESFESKSTQGSIDEPALVSVNAIYFKADWASRFEEGMTEELPFTPQGGAAVTAPMMHQRSTLPYAESESFQFLELPYKGGDFSMHVILPREHLDARRITATLTTAALLKLAAAATPHAVDVLLPRFEMKAHLDGKKALQDLGVSQAFDPNTADFDRMIIPNWDASNIYVSEIAHDAWIAVDEEGTEAAAATSSVNYSLSCSVHAPPPAEFHADHPFLFLIVHIPSRSILLAGWIGDPATP